MNIKRNGSQASGKGNTDWFTGTVRIDQPFQAEEPARVGGATVTFEQGARTAWHTRPLGQTLLVTAGLGWAQRENGPLEESGKIVGDELGDWAIWSVVEQSSKQIGIEHFGAHDLRRTCAKLCRKSGGDLEQIKFLLGHSSIQTTERYLGSEQEIEIAVNDNLGL